MDTKPLELEAERSVEVELLRYKFDVTKPTYDKDGTDLLVVDSVRRKFTKTLRIQCKGRSASTASLALLRYVAPLMDIERSTRDTIHQDPDGGMIVFVTTRSGGNIEVVSREDVPSMPYSKGDAGDVNIIVAGHGVDSRMDGLLFGQVQGFSGRHVNKLAGLLADIRAIYVHLKGFKPGYVQTDICWSGNIPEGPLFIDPEERKRGTNMAAALADRLGVPVIGYLGNCELWLAGMFKSGTKTNVQPEK